MLNMPGVDQGLRLDLTRLMHQFSVKLGSRTIRLNIVPRLREDQPDMISRTFKADETPF